jgi:hypothetical protein
MFEDMLAYEPWSLLNRRFAELLAADLDDDAHHFYADLTSDVAVAAARAGRAPDATRISRVLLEALVAAPAARPACWRRLYRQIGVLVAHCPPSDRSGVAPDSPALARLRQFLRENVDLAEQPPAEVLERMALGQAARA